MTKPVELKKEDKPLTGLFGVKTLPKEEKPMTNLFGTKSANITPAAKPQEVPKAEVKAPIKVVLKAAEKSKENVPEKVAENVPQEQQKQAVEKKEPEVKPLGAFNFGSNISLQPVVSSANVPPS